MKIAAFFRRISTLKNEVDRRSEQLLLEPLEARILYSAAPVEAPPEGDEAGAVEEPAQVSQDSGNAVGNGSASSAGVADWRFDNDPNSTDHVRGTIVHSDHDHDDDDDDDHDELHVHDQYIEPESAPGDGSVVWDNYNLNQTFFLHSNPGANHTVYLDFDGHTTTGTDWNTHENNGNDIITPAYDPSGDGSAFNNQELARIQRIWAAVAEDFIPFDVNITTEDPGVEALRKTGGGDTQWGIRVVIGPNTFFDPAGGVAYLNSFNDNIDTPTFVFNGGENGVIEAASHEIGHTLGLRHDGTSTEEYYDGHGSGATSWGSIMGAAYGRNLTHWNNGTYGDANNQEDDLTIITDGRNGFGYRADDYGNSIGTSFEVLAKGNSTITTTYGIVERNTDQDYLSFWASAGALSLNIDTVDDYYNLDILANIYDSNGTLVATSNPVNDVDASFNFNLNTSGEFFLSIEGTGNGNPLTTGYTDYGSLGSYRVTGSAVAYPLEPPPSVTTTSGSGSPTEHGIGDVISVAMDFSGGVTLSSSGDAKITLNIGGQMIDAIHTGATTGTRLTFQAISPIGVLDPNGIEVVANSLTLLNGATLVDSIDRDAFLTHSSELLGNDTVDGIRPIGNIVDLTPDPRYTNAGTMTIQFPESVTGVDIGDFNLTFEGQSVDISGLSVTGSGSTYSIDLSSVTGGVGDYVLTLNASGTGIEDSAGNDLVIGATDSWTVLDDVVGEITKISDGSDPDLGGGPATNIVYQVDLKTSSGQAYVNNTGTAITYTFSTSGTASRGIDFDTPASTVSIADGESTATITIEVFDDTKIEGTETVFGRISNASIGGVNPALASARAEITDADRATVLIDDVSVSEDGGSVNVTATLSASVNGGFTVELKLAGDTATPQSDFQGTTRVLTFAGNPREQQTVSVPILNDMLAEGDETIDLYLANLRPNTADSSSINIADTAVLTIQDDDLPVAHLFSINDGAEGDGAGTTDIEYRVELRNAAGDLVTNGTGGEISFEVDFGGTATAGSDYDAPPATISVANGGNTGSLIVAVRDDNDVDSNETVVATLANPSLGTIGTGSASATITDADRATVTLGDATFNEDDGTLTIVATLDNSVSGGFSVDALFTDLEAVGGEDYDNASQTLVFQGNAGEMVNLTIPMIDDFEIENVERFRVALGNLITSIVPASAFTISDTAIGSIADDDINNVAPVLSGIDDQVISHTEANRVVTLETTDAEGDEIFYTVEAFSVSAVDQLAYDLDQANNFKASSSDYRNHLGLDERWFLAGSSTYHYILPTGEVFRSTGGTQSLGTLDSSFHADLTKLFNVEAPVITVPDVTLTVDGDDLTIDPADTYRGDFTVRVMASDGVLISTQEFSVAVTNIAPVLPAIDDQSMSHNEANRIVALGGSDPDGGSVNYNVEAFILSEVDQKAYDLDQARNFKASSNDFRNHLGQDERWFLDGANAYHYILPSGEVFRSTGGTQLLETLDSSFHDDLSKLFDVAEPAPIIPDVMLSVIGDDLTINPAEGFLGAFTIRVTASDGASDVVQEFGVTVTNNAPVLPEISDQTISHNEANRIIDLGGSDVDGDVVDYTVEAFILSEVDQKAYDLDQVRNFKASANDFRNYLGQDDRWFLDGTNKYYYILPTGEVFRSTGGTQFLETLDSSFHADLTKLFDVAEPTPIIPDVTLSVDGDDLTIDPGAGFLGAFTVRVTASDGVSDVFQEFGVDVTNTAPVLPGISDQTMSHNEANRVVGLGGSDLDGDVVDYTVEAFILSEVDQKAYDLDQVRNFKASSSDYRNYLGQDDRWFLDGANKYYYILPTGEVYRSTGGTQLLDTLDSSFHADLTKLFDVAEPTPIIPDVTLSVDGDDLTIDPGAGFLGAFTVRVTASDGVSDVIQEFGVNVTNSAPVLPVIEDQTISYNDGNRVIDLGGSDVDGDVVDYAVEAFILSEVDQKAYNLDQARNFKASSSDFRNYLGQDERWFLDGTNKYYYILPTGEVYRSTGGTLLLETLDSSFHADLTKLFDVAEPVPIIPEVTVSVDGDDLTIDPGAEFRGAFTIRVTASDGVSDVVQEFGVNVTNIAPVLDGIGDQSMTTGEGSRILNLTSTDADGDPVNYSAEFVVSAADQLAFDLDQVHNFKASGNEYRNFNGTDERWFFDGTNRYHYILPNGDVYRAAGAQLLGTLDSSYHTDLTKLFNVADPTTLFPDVTLAVDGSQLTITPNNGYTGTFRLRVIAGDGENEDSEEFNFTVTSVV